MPATSPQEHLQAIADFIDKNTANITLGAEAPMTQGADPFTGANNAMYEASRAGVAPTGGGGAGAGTVTFASSEHIPKKAMIFFETPGKADAVEKKLLEFNDALAAGGATSGVCVSVSVCVCE